MQKKQTSDQCEQILKKYKLHFHTKLSKQNTRKLHLFSRNIQANLQEKINKKFEKKNGAKLY